MDSFDRLKELGVRLRELRLKSGLKQSELASLMGRQGKGRHNLVSRIERSVSSGSARGATPNQLHPLAAFTFAHLDPMRSTIPPDQS